jgi:hypothetical protein
VDDTPQSVSNRHLRECNADDFAVKLGLSESLISGLNKILVRPEYSFAEIGLRQRVDRLMDF